jgi:hypothetical protein
MALQFSSGSLVPQLAPQLKIEVLYFVTELRSQKLRSQRVSGEKFCADTYWLPSSGSPVKHRDCVVPTITFRDGNYVCCPAPRQSFYQFDKFSSIRDFFSSRRRGSEVVSCR